MATARTFWKGLVISMSIIAGLSSFSGSCQAAGGTGPAPAESPSVSAESGRDAQPLEYVSYSCNHMNYYRCFYFNLDRQDADTVMFSFSCSSSDNKQRWESEGTAVPPQTLNEVGAILQKHHIDRNTRPSISSYLRKHMRTVFEVADATTYSFSVRWQGQEESRKFDSAGPCAQDLEQYFRRLAERYRSADGTKE